MQRTANPKLAFPVQPTANPKRTFLCNLKLIKPGLPSATTANLKRPAGASQYNLKLIQSSQAFPVQPTANPKQVNPVQPTTNNRLNIPETINQ